jgi:hypothetical protein
MNLALMPLPKPNRQNQFLADHAKLLLDSFASLTGKALIDPTLSAIEQAQQLFEAPFAVLSHNTAPDPIFTYGNQMALQVFALTWEELTQMPSRLSTEPIHQAERHHLLTMAIRQGYVDDYGGVRITKTGRRFLVEQATVWNLLDEAGHLLGQATLFSHWIFLD